MRFAVWAAVSTKPQAKGHDKPAEKKAVDDKDSLENQESSNRAAGLYRGWVETCKPYIMAHSRSYYVNLSDAERDIPALRAMLEDARADKFDVLIIYSYDRLGDLADMIAQSLKFYGKQIFSVNQPVEPQDPEHYDPFAAEAEAIMRDASRITQRFRINDLKRKRVAGMPIRIKRGLNPSRVAFGYRWVGKKEPPELQEQKSELVIRMKDMLLAGEPVADLIRYANSTGIKPPNGGRHWQDSSIRAMLVNPFYAGFVSINRFKTVRDPRAGRKPRQIKLPRSKWIMEHGLHVPLWDEHTYNLIVAELESRRQAHIHHRVRYPFAGILFCECGAKLNRASHGHGQPRPRVWVCSRGKSEHFVIPYDEGAVLVAVELAKEFEQAGRKPKEALNTSAYDKQIEDLRARKKRIQEAYEEGGYDKADYLQKVSEIDGKIEDLQAKIANAEQTSILRENFVQRFSNLQLRAFPVWIKETNPATVNSMLRVLFEKITIHPNKTVTFTWR